MEIKNINNNVYHIIEKQGGRLAEARPQISLETIHQHQLPINATCIRPQQQTVPQAAPRRGIVSV